MKIRITDPGFAGFNGHMGTAFFVDGVCDDVSPQEAERMASILSFEEVDTGVNPSVTQRMVDHINKNADEMGINSNSVLTPSAPAPASEVTEPGPDGSKPAEDADKGLNYDYTVEDLSALADKEGIAGLRAFSESYGVNGRSISGIVGELMELKALHSKPVQKTEEELATEAAAAAKAEADLKAELEAEEAAKSEATEDTSAGDQE